MVALSLAFTACERHDLSEVENMEGHHARGAGGGPSHEEKEAKAYQDDGSANAPLQSAPTAQPPEGQAASSQSGGSREKAPTFFPKDK